MFYDRLFHPSSPLTTPITSGWESFPGYSSSGPRMSSAESFRLSLLQLSEREREFSSRLHPSQLQLRPPHYSNGPFMNLPLGMGGPLGPTHPPGGSTSSSSSSNSSTKSSPLGGPIPLLNPSVSSLGHLHHSSQNGPGSPTPIKSEDMSVSRGKDDSR